ncbi:hypothetical protein [Pseudomonas cerasi]|uniref:hypothetical protein n=1 Tax=Pseudomonas cerasi TaxID=1583341 RepID=UPI0012FF9ACE|nr:hypothetical protein [Pseudomonas cerasi]
MLGQKSAIRPGSIFNRQGGSVFNQRQQPPSVSNDPFAGFDIVIKGSIGGLDRETIFIFQLVKDDRSFIQTSVDFQQTGYGIIHRGPCVAELTFPGSHRTVLCSGAASGGGERLGSERAAATGGGSSSPSNRSSSGSGNVAAARGVPFTVVADTSRGPRTLPVTSAN